MPDIDIDFCVERRSEVLEYVTKKYGKDKVAQIITFGTLSARSVIRDVGRALDVPYADVDAVAKMVPFKIGQTIDNALSDKALKDRYENDPVIHNLINCARELEGLPRHASTHAAGVVITKNTLSDYVPLQLSDEMVITQFTMTTLEELGLLKMDFLGLRNLTMIRDTLRNLKEKIDISKIDENKKEVYDLISSGDTDGVFQLESSGMKAFMRELKPTNIEDLIAGISLYRPGPAESIPRYIKNKNNPLLIKYKHTLLEPILKSTYGCIVYQEQVMQIVQVLAGYSLGRADLLRRAMGKKKPEVIKREESSFIYGDDEVEGAVGRGVPEKVAKEIFDEMTDFGKYAFNKSHAAAYAKIAYQTAYLKAFYPVHFMCALMSSQMYDTPKIAHYISELYKMGISMLPPDINKSKAVFTAEGRDIRFGLAAAKNVGKNVVDEIVSERKNGEFKSLKDFCLRMGDKNNKRAIEALVRCGAFDSLGGKRSQYLAIFEKSIDDAADMTRNNFLGQLSLLGVDDMPDDLPNLSEFSKNDLLAMEKEVIGIYVSGHPLDSCKDLIQRNSNVEIGRILAAFNDENAEGDIIDGQAVKIAGIITSIKRKLTKRDAEMAFMTVEDLTGSVEVIIFPKVFARFESIIKQENIISILGKVSSKEDEEPKIIADMAINIDVESESKKLYVKIPWDKEDKIDTLKEILKIYNGNVPVYLYFDKSKKTFAAPREFWVQPCDALNRRLTELLGENGEIVLTNTNN